MGHHHKILEVDENCSIDEIKQAYRRLAKKYHPDLNKAANAQQKFIEISEAYQVLLEEAKNAAQPSTNNTDSVQNEYNEFIRRVREQARKQAKMRYQKFAQQQEEFRESGLQDFVLLTSYFGRILEPLLGLFLIALPVLIGIHEKSLQPFFISLVITWTFGGILLLDVYSKRKRYFKLGDFYYSFGKIMNIYTQTHNPGNEVCFYCTGLKANSRPYVINLVKVKKITLKNRGPLQHQAGYDRENMELKFPRSQKAFIVHSFTSVIKLLAILACMILLPFESSVWSFVTGAVLGFLVSSVLLIITRTYSKNAYLFSYGIIIKIIVWIVAIGFCTKINFQHLNFSTNGYIRPVIILMVFFDSFLEQFIKTSKKHLFKPILHHYMKMEPYFDKNYQLYLEIPGWTIIYPIIRWIF